METDVSLRILFVEDLPTDAELAQRELRRGGIGFASLRVETKDAFLQALREFQPDLIVSDYCLPQFDGMQALKLCLEHDEAIPFIVLTGSMNEETAVECMKAGASDYVIKENITRLPFAVKAALDRNKTRLARVKAEAALSRAKSDWEDTFDTVTDMITVHDENFNIILANKAAREMLAIPSGHVVFGVKCFQYYHGASKPPAGCPSCQCMKTGKPSVTEVFEPHLNRHLEIRAIPRLGKNNHLHGMVHVVRDITERKLAEDALRKSEDQLRQAQKMEAVGRLAGGVAHDFNNLLTIILGCGELLLTDLAPEHPHRNDLQDIYDAGLRARNLTRQLLAFGRKQTLEMLVVDINEIIGNFEKLLRRTIGEDIVVHLALSPSAVRVRADISQMEQVLMNLAVNARDAMPDGGRLAIETAVADLDEAYAAGRPGVIPGRYVMIAFSDEGCGMDREVQEHIFEPFFSTKEKNKGTGLGLSTVYGIVKQHGGNIWVYSEPGQGTTFRIYLPLVSEAVKTEEKRAGSLKPMAGSATVLVVEDEPSVRKLACAILKKGGNRILEAGDTSEAISISRAFKGPIDLVLTDVVMPGLKGTEVYQEIAVSHPEARVLFMSGYTDDVIVRQGALKEGMQFIQKPFSVASLLEKVRAVLLGSQTRMDTDTHG